MSALIYAAGVLTGAALIRERERGTLEHLLVMPVTPFEIMVSKVWSMALVVLVATGLSLWIVVQDVLKVPIAGSFGMSTVRTSEAADGSASAPDTAICVPAPAPR